MRRANQVDDRCAGRHRALERRFVERIADNRVDAGREPRFRSRPHEGVDIEAACQQRREQRTPEVAGAAGDDTEVINALYGSGAARGFAARARPSGLITGA